MSAPALLIRDVHSLELLPDIARECGDRRGIRELELKDGGAPADALDLGGNCSRIVPARAEGDRDIGARARESDRDRAANSSRCTGHERDFAGERIHCVGQLVALPKVVLAYRRFCTILH